MLMILSVIGLIFFITLSLLNFVQAAGYLRDLFAGSGLLSAFSVFWLFTHMMFVNGLRSYFKSEKTMLFKTVAGWACVPVVSPLIVLGIPFGIWGLLAVRNKERSKL
jgi:hypothetical protein